MEKLYHPVYINFSLWASDPDNEGQLQVFHCVCSVINPSIGLICDAFGYEGYLHIVASLVLFFADLFDEDRDEALDLIRIFPLLHDAGAAAITPVNSSSEQFLECLYEVNNFREITEEFVANCFPQNP
ncbi:hypothetical protein [Nostoc sp. DedQUE07]|uniref:hypothetical protein n=1 Tax=Nostoc sp. DedQUE07 TaxID=3075392 RepID=UPI002AD5312C|nr:hypothetical protein [Nostoc sp. DedQUE07]MDZ8131983.1 hypothetical protein [Nostoc sp. DedQUE07]